MPSALLLRAPARTALLVTSDTISCRMHAVHVSLTIGRHDLQCTLRPDLLKPLYSNKLTVQCDRGISLLGKVCFMAEKVSNVLNPVLYHRWSLLRDEEWRGEINDGGRALDNKKRRRREAEATVEGGVTYQRQAPSNHADTGRESHRPQHFRSEHTTIA